MEKNYMLKKAILSMSFFSRKKKTCPDECIHKVFFITSYNENYHFLINVHAVVNSLYVFVT